MGYVVLKTCRRSYVLFISS